MSFIIALSYQKFYGIMATNKTFNSDILLYFLAKLIESKRVNNLNTSANYLLVWDNWSIHKTSKIAKFLTQIQISMVTIPPYTPWLNAAEIMINRIKGSINKQRRLWK